MSTADTAPPNRAHGQVYIVEDDEAVRDSLALLLGLRGFGTDCFASAEQFLAAAPSLLRPGCALVDVRLPGMTGLELQALLRSVGKATPVIVMTAHGDVATARAALLAGAVDFLQKPVDEGELVQAITTALRSDLEQAESSRSREQTLAQMSQLTEREREVFGRITDGLSNREIAEQLLLSQKTVESYRWALMQKLHARRVADLFRLRLQLDAQGGRNQDRPPRR